MPGKRLLAGLLFIGVLGGTLATSKSADLGILLKAGRKAKQQFANVMPESRRLTEPLSAFRAGDALPIEERVRVRIQTDKSMQGSEVTVGAAPEPTTVRLRGVVLSSAQKSRAHELATTTAGVEGIIDELAVPEGK